MIPSASGKTTQRWAALALALLMACVLFAVTAAAPASAKQKKKSFCAKQIKMLNATNRRYTAKKRSGGITFYVDKKNKDDFIACSEKRKTTAEGENFDDDPAWTLKKFVGANDRCAIAVMQETNPHTYNGVTLGSTVVASFRLIDRNGTGFSYSAEPGTSAGFDVPSVKFTKNCYAGWSEVRPGGRIALSVLDIGNKSRYEDPNVIAFSYFTNGLVDPNAWLLADNGKGATLSWTDSTGPVVKQIPAP